ILDFHRGEIRGPTRRLERYDLRQVKVRASDHRDFTSDADVRQTVRTVRRHFYVEHRILTVTLNRVNGQTNHGQPLSQFFGTEFGRCYFFEPVATDEHE